MVSRLELGLVVGVGVDADADADAGVNVILGILTRADGIALVVVTRIEEVGAGVDSVAGVSCPRFLFLGTS